MRFVVLIIFLAQMSCFQTGRAGNITLNPSKKSVIEIKANDMHHTIIHTSLYDINTSEVNTPLGVFSRLSVPGYSLSQIAGSPELPVLRRLIEIPSDAEVKVVVLSSHFTDISLQDMNISDIIPAQPLQLKSTEGQNIFRYDTLAYQKNSFGDGNLADADILGYLRGMRLGRINIFPLQYNPITRILRIYDDITIDVQFSGPNSTLTRSNRQKNANLYFRTLNQLVLNPLPLPSPLDTIIQYPVKYVIVSNVMFQSTLQPFIEWKKKKGFTVIEAYTNNPAVGNTAVSIKNYLQGLYDAATPGDPAPSFILLAGDVAQLPTFPGALGAHPTDLYYGEFTGDYIPDVYYGRFSAVNTAQLQAEIEKTMSYEQYSFPDPAFLNECVLIAGTDASFGPTHANGQVNYGTSTYFNAAHGLNSHTYLYPASGSQDAQIIQDVSNGCGYVNYTAHGSSGGWADPTFTVSNVASLNNLGKYPLMVGNACLTNKFDDSECFGEALIRASGKGALGYIGASDNTYWDEDFWWAVGAKPVSVNPTYSPAALGAYDRTFHDHGEAYADWFMTQGQMIYAGNLAVMQASPAASGYYWEIYHLMGDPSLMVYFSEPSTLQVTYNSPLPLDFTTFTLSTEPYAYAAVSQSGILHGAAQADASGVAVITLSPFTTAGTADVVVTCQNFQPYTGTLTIQTPDAPLCMLSGVSVNDSNGNQNGQADYGENILLNLGLYNAGLQDAANITVTVSSADTNVGITDSSAYVALLPAGNSTILTGDIALTLGNSVPDGHSILFLTTITDGLSVWTYYFSIIAHAPVLTYLGNTIADAGGNNNGRLDAGESDTITIIFRNSGSSVANSVQGTLATNSPFVTLTSQPQLTALVNPGESASQSFSLIVNDNVPAGETISFTLSLSTVNGLASDFPFELTVGQIPVLILNLDGNNNSAQSIQEAIQANNINSEISTTFPVNPEDYAAIFICLGVYNNNHKLTLAEGTLLATYLNNGGKIYMEGGDTWFFNTVTPVHPMFNITGLGDGTSDLDTLNGQSGTLSEGMHFRYSGDNNYIDRISPKPGTTAFSILKNTSPNYSSGVAFAGNNYKTIGASHEFAGLNNGNFPSTRNQLMKRYLEFFGLVSDEVIAGFTGSPTSLMPGNSVNFTDTSSGSPVSWNWFFPGGTPTVSASQNPVISYFTPGTYPVSLTAANFAGNSTLIKSDYITVNPNAFPCISLGSYSGCAGTFRIPVYASGLNSVASISFILNFPSADLTYTGYYGINPQLNGSLFINQSGNAINFVWFTLTPISIAFDTLINLDFQALTTGNFQLNWNTSAPGNCELTNFNGDILPSAFYNGQVVISPAGTPAHVFITASPPSEICSGTEVTFTAFGSNTGISPEYQWKLNGIVTGSGNTFTSSLLSNGDVITCVLTSSSSCASGNPATSNAIIMAVGLPPLISLGNDTLLPFGQTITLTPGPGFETYLWSTGSNAPEITVGSGGVYSVTVTTASGCAATDTILVSVIAYNSISGTLKYLNGVQSPLANTLIQLKSGNAVVTHTLTSSDGSFVLSPVNPGTYSFNVVCSKPWGGVNSTDALLTMKHFVGMSYLTGLFLKAADVDLSNMINALDALAIQRRVVGLLSFFPAGDWIFTKPTVNFTGMQATSVNISGLCNGDVNGSHLPPSAASPSVMLEVNGQLTVSPANQCIIPVKIENSANPGAISLFLQLPEQLEILDINCQGSSDNLIWNFTSGKLAISWFAVNGLHVDPTDVLFNLTAKVKAENWAVLSESIRLLDLSDISDADGRKLNNIKLSIPNLRCESNGLRAWLSPNPFNTATTLHFNLVKSSQVDIRVLDLPGRTIKIFPRQVYPAGEHQLKWEAENVNEGLYYLQIKTADETLTFPLIKSTL